MRRRSWIVIAFLLCCSTAWAKALEGAPGVTVTLDREDALYKVGEKVVFTIKVAHKDGKPVENKVTVHLDLTNDGEASLVDRKVEIGDAPETVEYTFKDPGFVRLTAIGRSWKGQRTYLKSEVAAACEPEKIEPVVTMPDDFDTFWQKGRERLAQIPLDLRQERIEHLCDDQQDTYKVSFANIDNTRIYGYLLIPKTGKEKYPCLVAVAPAGKGKPREANIIGLNQFGTDEAICLYMGVYDHDLGLPKEHYRTYVSKDGDVRGATGEAEKYFFYRAILGVDRAVTWLASRKDVDSRHIVYYGGSQGGGMGLAMTGFNKAITAANVNIPALCDHLGFRAGRQPGWPGVLGGRTRRKMSKEQIDAIARMLPYFDAVNFARKITVPVLLTMGYVDTTCPPTGVYAAYNVITSPKQIVTNPHHGHAVPPNAKAAVLPWIRSKLGISEKASAQEAVAPQQKKAAQ